MSRPFRIFYAMIKLATPISHMFMQPHSSREIIAVSDSLECREWCTDAPYPKQDLMHFDIDILHHWTGEVKRYIHAVLRSKTSLELVTFHMASCYDAPVVANGMYQPGGKRSSREELLRNTGSNIVWIRSFLSESILIGVENNNYYPTPAYRHITDGSFITRILEENAVSFLYDIAHGIITAHNLSVDYRSYRATLPLEKAIQLHVSRHRIDAGNIAIDAHEIPNDEMYHEVKELIAEYPIRYLTIEYYRNPEAAIRELVKFSRLKEEMNRG